MMEKILDGSVQSSIENGSGRAPCKIDQSTFTKRLQAFYSHWREHKDELWGSADYFAISTPPSDDVRYLMSSTFIVWLLGYELPETIMVFGSKQICFLCGQKNDSLLESVKRFAKEAVDVDVVIHVKLKREDGTSKMDAMLHSMCSSKSEVHDPPIVGYIAKESPESPLLEEWADKLRNSGLQLSDVTHGLSDLFAVKDPNEVTFAKKTAYLTASGKKGYDVPKSKRVIVEETEGTNSSLMGDTEKVILDPARIQAKLNANSVYICYPTIFQSGGKFDLKRMSLSNDDFIFYDSPTVVIRAMGSQDKKYCYVARTFLIDANAFQCKAYEVLLRAHEAAINAVKPGNKVSDVYSAALAVVQMDAPELVPNLTMTAGTSIGLVFRDSGLAINLKNDPGIKPGLVYKLSLGFRNLLTETGNPKSRIFSLLLGDTVAVTNYGHDVITQLSSKDVKEVTFSFNDAEKELEPGVKAVYSERNVLCSKTTLLSDKKEILKEELQRQHQAELARQKKNEETAKRLARGDSAVGYNWASLKTSNELIGSRYNNYCSIVARTFLIDANAFLNNAYKYLLRAHEVALNAVKPGNKLSAVYPAALAVVQMDAPDLVPNLSKTAGTGVVIEFCESGLAINLNNDKVIKAGMVFIISLGFQNLLTEPSNPNSQIFSLLLSDTVVVTNGGRDVITQLSFKDAEGVTYSFNDTVEELEPIVEVVCTGRDDLFSSKTLLPDNQEISKEELRRQHQTELARKKNEETARRLAAGDSAAGVDRANLKTSNELIAYKSVNDLPLPCEMMIQVDQKNEAVLLPVYDAMVPFHVATVKTVSSQQDANHNCYIRIIFNVPRVPITSHDADSSKDRRIYLKEVSFHSKDPKHISEVVQQIKTLRRYVVARESEIAERAMLVVPAKLELARNKFKPIRLSDVLIRPPFDDLTREMTGALEAHANGFRYSTSRQEERVDIMYVNIKHAFFQPAENEKITLLHFHLHDHVMVGNKKTKDVQFNMEVMDLVQTLGSGRRSTYHPDEIEEQRERNCKSKINMDFQNFVNSVHELWGQPQFKAHDLKFDQPQREVGFHGIVPNKASAFIVPTSSCLVELIESPFLIITLSEIEIVNLERTNIWYKNFDMAIVFKDFKHNVMRIDSIPSISLDGVKEWLDTIDMKYYESRLNLNWRAILKAFTDDPHTFIDVGGWEFLNIKPGEPDYDSPGNESDYDDDNSDSSLMGSNELDYDDEDDDYYSD